MIIDLIVVIVIAASIGISYDGLLFVRLVILLKLPQTKDKVDKL